jgi:hypothetical protein
MNNREKIPMIEFAKHNDSAWKDADDTRRSGSLGRGRPEGERWEANTPNTQQPSCVEPNGNALAPASRRAPQQHQQAGGEAGAEPEKDDRAERSRPVVGIDHENDFAAHSRRERGIAAFGE